MRVLFRGAEVEGALRDVEVRDGLVTQVAASLCSSGADLVVDCGGGALLPGLHDHHLHLLGLAAARSSVACGPPAVPDRDALAAALTAADRALPPGAWLRGTGYHESVAGDLDRDVLDVLVPDRPVRVQHRSGALWMLNSRAVDLVEHGLDGGLPWVPDIERDASGRPRGRLWRQDHLLTEALAPVPPPLAPVDRELTALGLTGVTDATPDLDEETQALLEGASARGDLRARLHLLGGRRAPRAPRCALGPVKLLLHDHDLPSFDALAERVLAARAEGRAVAVHVVTRLSLVLTLAVLETTGVVPGDRIEHAAVVPGDLRADLARLGLAVVTQPGFLRTRGDHYRAEVEPDDLACLYPYAGLVEAGVPVAASSDAPYGPLDPWQVIAAATERSTDTGRVLGAHERVSAATALAGYLSPPEAPGGPPRRLRPGAVADLCLLHAPLAEALSRPHRDLVREVFHGAAVLPNPEPTGLPVAGTREES